MSRSKLFRRIRRAAIAAVLILIAAGVALYLAASWVPARYRPADIAARERHEAAQGFIEGPLAEFANKVQVPKPFSITISQDRFNAYLASMDEIAALAPAGRPGEVRARMERAGLDQPAVAIEPGVLTLMVDLSDYGKVLSADLSFDFLPGGMVQIRLLSVRVGRLTVPRWLLGDMLQRLRQSLAPASRSARRPDESLRDISLDDVSALLVRVLASIDQKPISTELPLKVGGRKLRVESIELRDGNMTLSIGPMP